MGHLFWTSCFPAGIFEETKMCVEYPAEIPGTRLVALNLVCYDGPFLEDDLQDEMTEITGVILENGGELGISEGLVRILQDGRELQFRFSQLPPGGKILVLEQDGQQYFPGVCTEIDGWVIEDKCGWYWETLLQIEELPPGGVAIHNITDAHMGEVKLFYKAYYPVDDFYIGGKSYIITAEDLLPGETLALYPEYYCCGISRILRVQYNGQESDGKQE